MAEKDRVLLLCPIYNADMRKTIAIFSLLMSSPTCFGAETLQTVFRCQSGGPLTETSLRVEVLLSPDYYENRLSRGIVLLQHWSLNPEGNHAFAPDMIFLKDYYLATVEKIEGGLSLSDPSGADMKITSDGKTATLKFTGNRNVRRSFTVETPATLNCQKTLTTTQSSANFQQIHE